MVSMVLSGSVATAQEEPELTVLRQLGSQSWPQVAARLEQSDIDYQTLDGSDLTPETLAQTQVLFLANVEQLDSDQMQAISDWVNQGSGQLIVSGPLQVPPEWEQSTRTLLGSYWSRNLASATTVVPTSFSSSEWAQGVTADTQVEGGFLLPNAVNSRLIARWSGFNRDAYAVIATQQSVYLGWRWGEVDPDVDEQWLEAALSRAETILAKSTENLDARAVQATDPSLDQSSNPTSVQSATPAPTFTPLFPAGTPNPAVDTPSPSIVDEQGSAPDPTFTPLFSIDDPGIGAPSVLKTPAPDFNTETETSPVITAAPLTVNTFEVLSMKLELRNLVGRVESALILTQSTQSNSRPDTGYEKVIANARDVIRNLEDWVMNNEHTKARQEFEQARAQLWANYPINALTTLPEVRAIWLDRGTIVEAGSEQGLAEVFDRLANARINTVFFETINAGYPIYPSRIAPEQNPLTRGWDPLRSAVKLARERGIELHCWMWTFATGNRRHNVLPEISLPRDYIGPVLTAYPDWANLDHRGRLFPGGTQTETWLDPANPEVRAYLLALVDEMIEDYGVDGIHLDYIRYPFQNAASGVTFGYGSAARQQFEQMTGVDPLTLTPRVDRSLWQLWTDFRVRQVDSFVGDVANLIQATDPQVILSAAVYALPENERVQKLQQDWERWITAGDLDLLIPLTYAGNTRRLAQLVEPNLDIVKESPVLFLPSLKLLDLPKVEFLDQMQVVRDLPTGGYSLFAARQLTDELQDVLSQSALSSSQIPYRDPFKAAQARFQVLKSEWDFLLDSDSIRILDDQRVAWLQQINDVENALSRLANNPSQDGLTAAQSTIEELRFELEEWMRLDALQNPYRLETWTNRLAAMEILLRYGNRVLPRLTAMESQ